MDLRQMIADAISQQTAIRDAAVADGNRALTTEEQANFDELQRSIDAWNEQLRNGEPNQENNPDNVRSQATQEERNRINAINSLCRDFGVEPRQFIDNGSTIDQIRESILNGMRQSDGPLDVSGSIAGSASESEKLQRAATDALLLRSGFSVKKPADGATELRAMSLRSIAEETLEREGTFASSELRRMDGSTLYNNLARAFMNPTAAFPAILDNTIQKSIVEIYKKVPTTFQRWTEKGQLSDFKTTKEHNYVIGGVGDFVRVPENGEIKADKPDTILLPERKLDTYGKQFSMSRQAFINDDISFLSKVPGIYSAAAKRTIDKECYKIIFNNSKIFDGKTLFHASHKNIITSGTAPTAESIQDMILKMQLQKDHFGEAIYITPKAIIVPIGYGFKLKVIFNSQQIVGSSNNDINPMQNYPIEIIESPVLNAIAGTGVIPWFLVADPTSAMGLQVDYLDGIETPQTRRSEVAGQLGFVWDMWLDWGISVMDYRGIVRNDGVTLSNGVSSNIE